MPRMRWSDPLPAVPYVIPNERGIEIPLAMEVCQWRTCPGLILDAGASLNHAEVYQVAVPYGRIWHYTQSLASESLIQAGSHASYLCGDLRHLELADATCDHVVCISTLEHIGWDNRTYGAADYVCHPEGWQAAFRELWRVLKPGGRLFVSVPAGQVRMVAQSQRYCSVGADDLAWMATFGPSEARYFAADPVGSWREVAQLPPVGLEPPQVKQLVIGLACLWWEKPHA